MQRHSIPASPRGAFRALAAVLVALALASCSLFPDVKDETANWSADRLYQTAHEAMIQGNYQRAIKYFDQLEARFPYGRYAQQAILESAFANWRANETAAAIASCDRFIRTYPNHPNVDYAYYLKGLVNFNENTGLMSVVDNPDMSERDSKGTRESFDSFKDLVNRFPESKYADDSRARMRYLVNLLAQYEVNVARYYMKRGAYVAAANRAQYAVKNYPQAPALEEAVFIMVKAYDNMGMTDLRDAADRVMHKNFPDSKYLKGPVTLTAPWWKLWDPNW